MEKIEPLLVSGDTSSLCDAATRLEFSEPLIFEMGGMALRVKVELAATREVLRVILLVVTRDVDLVIPRSVTF